jgi:hypothetical protein
VASLHWPAGRRCCTSADRRFCADDRLERHHTRRVRPDRGYEHRPLRRVPVHVHDAETLAAGAGLCCQARTGPASAHPSSGSGPTTCASFWPRDSLMACTRRSSSSEPGWFRTGHPRRQKPRRFRRGGADSGILDNPRYTLSGASGSRGAVPAPGSSGDHRRGGVRPGSAVAPVAGGRWPGGQRKLERGPKSTKHVYVLRGRSGARTTRSSGGGVATKPYSTPTTSPRELWCAPIQRT